MSKPPRRITAARLDNIALHYLERFAASAESLRRVLCRRVERAARALDEDPAEGLAWVEALIARYQAAGLLDDRQFAAAKTRSLHRRGASTRLIRQSLSQKGVDGDTIDGALAELVEEIDGDTDLAAARSYARRRRLGPWRLSEVRAEHRDKDLAALGRAGFSWAVARAVVDGEGE